MKSVHVPRKLVEVSNFSQRLGFSWQVFKTEPIFPGSTQDEDNVFVMSQWKV